MTRALGTRELSVGATDDFEVEYLDYLSSGETISSFTTSEQTSFSLVISNEAISSNSRTVLGRQVSAGQSVIFRCTTGTAVKGDIAEILVTITTSDSGIEPGILKIEFV